MTSEGSGSIAGSTPKPNSKAIRNNDGIHLSKVAQILGNERAGVIFDDDSGVEDTPEGDRDVEIRLRDDIRSKNDILKRFQGAYDMDLSVELPSELSETEGIKLNKNENTDTYHLEMLDTPLKSKISIRTLRNEGHNRNPENIKSDNDGNNNDNNDEQEGDDASVHSELPTNKTEDKLIETFVSTPKDTQTNMNMNFNVSMNTQSVTQNSKEMMVPATNSDQITQTQNIPTSIPDEKATQLINTQANDYEVSESLLKLDDQSQLQETSVLHTSPINFASFHQSLIASNGIFPAKDAASELVQSPINANYRYPNHIKNTNTLQSTVVSEPEDQSQSQHQLQSQSESHTPSHSKAFNQGSQEGRLSSSEMQFKLTYYAKPTSQPLNNNDDNSFAGEVSHSVENFAHDGDHEVSRSIEQSYNEFTRLDTEQEYEQTQELPEVLDQADNNKIKQSFESEEPLNPSRKRKDNIIILDDDFEDSSTPFKIPRFQSTFKELRNSDPELLTSKDISCNNAVWYYFSDCNYYPGKVVSQKENEPGFCTVQFETRQNDVKIEDIYYLDLRCGEKLHWKMNEYEVVALECRNPNDSDVIRCIRGYDTVHLKRILRNGKLSKDTIVDSIGSVYITTEEWAKRAKIKLDDEGNKFGPLAELRRSARSRSARNSLSPIKKVSESCNNSTTEIYRDTFHDTTILHQIDSNRGTIFEKCLFVLSGLSDEDRKRTSYLIELQAGYVVNVGFEKLLVYDETSHRLKWQDSWLENYEFVCLVSGGFSRSPKYLEALALGFPVLHWRFIEQCLAKGQISVKIITQNLLPSGESNRFTSSVGKGVIKSSNIFQFLTNFNNSLTLKDQLDISTVSMEHYAVIVLGNSYMDFFIDFIFKCFKVSYWEYISTSRTKNSNEKLDSSVLDDLLNFREANSSKTKIIFINETSLQISKEWENAVSKSLDDKGVSDMIIEDKEWLVQTIINEEP